MFKKLYNLIENYFISFIKLILGVLYLGNLILMIFLHSLY